MGNLTRKEGGPPSGGLASDNVALFPVRTDVPVEPQLTAVELRRLRLMMEQFDAVTKACPVARNAIGG